MVSTVNFNPRAFNIYRAVELAFLIGTDLQRDPEPLSTLINLSTDKTFIPSYSSNNFFVKITLVAGLTVCSVRNGSNFFI
jgi:hypothetical protein